MSSGRPSPCVLESRGRGVVEDAARERRDRIGGINTPGTAHGSRTHVPTQVTAATSAGSHSEPVADEDRKGLSVVSA